MPPVRQSARVDTDARRRRQATACTECRNRRVKCSRERPRCTQCGKGDRICVYTNDIAPNIEFVIEPQSSGPQVGKPPTVSSNTWNSVIGQQMNLVNKSTLRAYLPGWLPFWTLTEDSVPVAENRLESVTPREAKNYIEGQNLVNYTFEQADPHPPTNMAGISHLSEDFMNSMCHKLPPPAICALFFERFVESIQPILPICHIPGLRGAYAEFWLNSPCHTSTELLVLILSVLYTGGANSEPHLQLGYATALLELYDELMREFDISAYYFTRSTSSIQLLQGYVIMNTFQASQLAPFAAFSFLPLAIRSAQIMRFHTNPKVADENDHLKACNQLWWHLLYLDTESTICSGLQSIIRPNDYDIRLSSNPYSRKFPSTKTPPQASAPEASSPVMLAMQGHWEFAHKIHIWFERMPEQHELAQFSRNIQHLQEGVGTGRKAEWARMYLELQVDRAHCMLGLRFWQLEQFKGTTCDSEVVRTSRSFLENFLQLSTLSDELGLSWFVPGILQPIHALMILLLHLHSCTHQDDEAHLSRPSIDQVFQLRRNRILSGTIVPLGSKMGNIRANSHSNPRYSALNMLKSRVWQKFGWDIHQPPDPFLELQASDAGLDLGPDDLSLFGALKDFASPVLDNAEMEEWWMDWESLDPSLSRTDQY